MNEIREIVTKAVISKGKKVIRIKESVNPFAEPFSVLGCWAINHEFKAEQINNKEVEVKGSFEINIWYSHDKNIKTDVAKHVINYNEIIKTRQLVKESIDNTTDVIARVIEQPRCTDALINDKKIEVEIVLEIVAEVIGETKLLVTAFSPIDSLDVVDDDDFTHEINEDFIET